MENPTSHIDFELLAKHFAGETSTQEEQALNNWLKADDNNARQYQAAWTLWIEAAAPRQKRLYNTDAAWKAIHARIDVPSQTRPSFGFMKVAAVITILCSMAFGWLMTNQESDAFYALAYHKVETQDKIEYIKLPDGSQVQLAPESSLYYHRWFKSQRSLRLEGKAYFQVKTDSLHPFQVKTGSTYTTVLGTAFDLGYVPHNDQVRLSVTEGLVRFEQGEQALLVAAGQSAMYANNSDRMSYTENNHQNAWRTHQLHFNNALLTTVVDALEFNFNLDIHLVNPAIGNCAFTGNLVTLNTLEIMETLALTMRLEIDMQSPQHFSLSGKECNHEN